MDTSTTSDRVAAVVALKTLSRAKSRMSTLPPALRARLARVMALDTLAALAVAVDELLVVSDQPDLAAALDRHGINARVIGEPVGGRRSAAEALNLALARGADLLTAEATGPTTVLTCVGDLPALRTSSVAQVLAASRGWARSFLPDHDGRGTTMLIAYDVRLDPRYGTEIDGDRRRGSAERHEQSGAVRLSLGDLPDARWDVDTLDDLRVASRLGVGPATAAMIDPATGAIGSYLPLTVVGVDREALTVTDSRAHLLTVSRSAYDGDPTHLVPGRRLHAVRVAGALRCWG